MESSAARVSPLRVDGLLEPGIKPPENLEVERGLLGSIFVWPAAYDRVSEWLRPEHFGSAVHGRIFEAIGKLRARGDVANPLTLKNLFDQDGALSEVGGAQYLARLAASAVTFIGAESYGRTIVDLYRRRELIRVGQEIVSNAFEQDLDRDADVLTEEAERLLAEVSGTIRAKDSGFQVIGDLAQEQLRATDEARKARLEGRKVNWARSGFADLDRKIIGLEPGELYVLAGRPSMGKSSLSVSIGLNVAHLDGVPVALFDLEGTGAGVARRLIARDSGVSVQRQRSGDLDQMSYDIDRLVAAAGRLGTTPLYVDDTPALSVGQLRSRAQRLKRQTGLGLIVVDYLQLMRPSEERRRNSSRVEDISEISRGLKLAAKDLGVPVLALAQLSRQVESRDDKRPQLQDLRDGGSIEQDADVVMFIFREEYYLSRSEPVRRDGETDEKFNIRHENWQRRCEEMAGVAEVIIAKQRHGPVGAVKLYFDGETGAFENLANPDYGPSRQES